MSVTLSLFAGAGAQFLDNNGNMLSGGLIYTYNAGTTTPLATYTSNLGTVAHPNPIILDSSGRVPGGEIWLSYGFGYKFVTKDSNNILIGTYDNIPSSAQPPIVNDASSISYEQGYTLTAGSFTVGKTYRIATIGSTNFQLIGATSNSVGLLFTATGVGSGTGTAQLSQTVQAKLQQYLSVLDFGADPTGVTDSSIAIQAALDLADSASGGGIEVYFPRGTYLIGTTLLLSPETNLIGENTGRDGTLGVPYGVVFKAKTGITDPSGLSTVFIMRDKGISSAPSNPWAYRVQIENIRFEGLSDKSVGGYWLGAGADNFKLSRCTFSDLNIGIRIGSDIVGSQIPAYFEHCAFYNTTTWFYAYKCGKSIRINNINGSSAVYVIHARECGSSLHLGLHQAHIEQLDASSTNGVFIDTCSGGFYNLSEVDIDTSVPAAWSLVEISNSVSVYPRVKILGATSNISTYNILKDNVLSNTYPFGTSPWGELSYNMETYTGQGQGALIDNTNISTVWTPVIADAATGGNVATFTLTGSRYVYNRGAVTVSFNASAINTTGMTVGNSVYICGLPYASSLSFNAQYGSCVTANVASALNVCSIPYNSQYVNINKSGGGNILVSDITSPSGQINFTITYIIA